MSDLVSRSVRGFALPVVMVTLAAVGAIAVAVIPRGAVGVGDVAAAERRAREPLLLKAGLARGILALLVPGDPLTEALRREETVAWEFADKTIILSVRSESDKLDLITADLGAVAQSIGRRLSPEVASQATAALMRRRQQLVDPVQILPLISRFSADGARLRDVVTVYGGRTEMRPVETSFAAEGAMAPTGERPIYTIRAVIDGRSRASTVTVMIEPEAKRYVVLDHADLDLDDPTSNQ